MRNKLFEMALNNKNIDSLDDQMLRDFFRDFKPDESPESLKKIVMSQVLESWANKPVESKGIFSSEARVWYLLGISILLVMSYLTDAQTLGKYWIQLWQSSPEYLKLITQIFNPIIKPLATLPPMLWFTSIGVLILLAIDKVFSSLSRI